MVSEYHGKFPAEDIHVKKGQFDYDDIIVTIMPVISISSS